MKPALSLILAGTLILAGNGLLGGLQLLRAQEGGQDPVAAPGGQDAVEGKLRPAGITPEMELAIGKGLQYLARTQGPEGSWRSAGSYGSYPVAMSALAGMVPVSCRASGICAGTFIMTSGMGERHHRAMKVDCPMLHRRQVVRKRLFARSPEGVAPVRCRGRRRCQRRAGYVKNTKCAAFSAKCVRIAASRRPPR